MTRTEMNMLTERFAEVTGKQNDSVMNPARCAECLGISQGALRKRVHDGTIPYTKKGKPLIFKADALEAISIACKEIEERTVIVYRQLCPCFQRGKCKHYPHNRKQGSQICDMECDRISYLKKQLACISADK